MRNNDSLYGDQKLIPESTDSQILTTPLLEARHVNLDGRDPSTPGVVNNYNKYITVKKYYGKKKRKVKKETTSLNTKQIVNIPLPKEKASRVKDTSSIYSAQSVRTQLSQIEELKMEDEHE